MAQPHQKDGDDGGQDAGQRDVPDGLPAGSAVQFGGLKLLEVDGRKGCQEDHAVPAEILPDFGGHIDGPEPGRVGQEGDGLPAKGLDDGIEQAVQADKVHHQAADDHNADEVGHVGDGLGQLFEAAAADLIEDKGEDDGNGEAEDQGLQAQNQGVADQSAKVVAVEKVNEIFKADKLS